MLADIRRLSPPSNPLAESLSLSAFSVCLLAANRIAANKPSSSQPALATPANANETEEEPLLGFGVPDRRRCALGSSGNDSDSARILSCAGAQATIHQQKETRSELRGMRAEATTRRT